MIITFLSCISGGWATEERRSGCRSGWRERMASTASESTIISTDRCEEGLMQDWLMKRRALMPPSRTKEATGAEKREGKVEKLGRQRNSRREEKRGEVEEEGGGETNEETSESAAVSEPTVKE